MTRPDRTVADVLAAALARHGVQHIFGQSIPTRLLLAAERAGIRQVGYRTENAGGAMADGYARTSGRIGVVAAQNGPAAALLVAPLAEALKASVPVLALVQEVPRANRDRNAFQELDHAQLMAGCCKWLTRIDHAARAERDLEHAITLATVGRPGPAVVLLPADVLAETAPELPHRRTALGSYPLDRPRPDHRLLAQTAEILADAEAPLIIAGGGVHSSGATDALSELQELASLPVATTTMGKGAVDEQHDLSIGVVGAFMGRHSPTWGMRDLIDSADAVLLIGTRTNENGTDAWRLLPSGAQFAHLDIAGEELSRNYDSTRLLGDARAGIEDLTALLGRRDLRNRTRRRSAVAEAIAETRRRAGELADQVTTSPATPIRPERVLAELDALIDDDTIVVADASYATVWAAMYLRARRAGQRFISPRGLAGLGWGLPLALGAKLANPHNRVVCVAGDGAFAHVWAELETAAREGIVVTVVLLDNSVLAFQKHAELHQFGAHTTAVDLAPIDHAAVAVAAGVPAVTVHAPHELEHALRTALECSGPALVEVKVDPGAHPPFTDWQGSTGLQEAGIDAGARADVSAGPGSR